MIVQAAAFYLFAGILLLCALMVITARNPVHSVLFLIAAFFNSAGLFVLLGAEFIAFLMVIVYVGAVAVLFLFVVMMLDISFADLRKGAMQYVPVGIGIAVLLLAELVFVYQAWPFSEGREMFMAAPFAEFSDSDNTQALGRLLYTDYVFAFQVAGLILLVAMIGAIVLTHRVRLGVRKQDVNTQRERKAEDVLKVNKVTPGTGV